jgi:hypothetical protein
MLLLPQPSIPLLHLPVFATHLAILEQHLANSTDFFFCAVFHTPLLLHRFYQWKEKSALSLSLARLSLVMAPPVAHARPLPQRTLHQPVAIDSAHSQPSAPPSFSLLLLLLLLCLLPHSFFLLLLLLLVPQLLSQTHL